MMDKTEKALMLIISAAIVVMLLFVFYVMAIVGSNRIKAKYCFEDGGTPVVIAKYVHCYDEAEVKK